MNRKNSAQQVLLLLAFLSFQAVPKTVATEWLLDDLCLLQPPSEGRWQMLPAMQPCSLCTVLSRVPVSRRAVPRHVCRAGSLGFCTQQK